MLAQHPAAGKPPQGALRQSMSPASCTLPVGRTTTGQLALRRPGWLGAADPQVCVLEEVARQPRQWEGVRTGEAPQTSSHLQPPAQGAGPEPQLLLWNGDHQAQHLCLK